MSRMKGETLETHLAEPRTPLEQEIAALGPWFHNLHLPDGTQTAPEHPLGDFPRFKWRQIAPHLPDNLDGWRVLDIGCNAGFYSLELAGRGAHVTGIDVDPRYLRQARWAGEQFGLMDRLQFRQAQIYDLARSDERFDLVFFMGVFYHLRYPLLALDIVAERVDRIMVFQTLTMPGEEVFSGTADGTIKERSMLRDPGWPVMAFVEDKFVGDPTNWWIPSHSAVVGMLRSSGMRVTAQPGHEIYLCEPDGVPKIAAQTFIEAQLDAATGR